MAIYNHLLYIDYPDDCPSGQYNYRQQWAFEESPLRILKKRYAKREITREEFEKMKDDVKIKIADTVKNGNNLLALQALSQVRPASFLLDLTYLKIR